MSIALEIIRWEVVTREAQLRLCEADARQRRAAASECVGGLLRQMDRWTRGHAGDRLGAEKRIPSTRLQAVRASMVTVATFAAPSCLRRGIDRIPLCEQPLRCRALWVGHHGETWRNRR